jgi:transcriptional regulator with XRE-family HTH domain
MFLEKKFADKIRMLRLECNLTQGQLAELINSNNKTVNGWERGIRTPSIDVIWQLADVFNTSIDYLVGRTDDPMPLPPAKGGDVTDNF